MRGWRPSRFAQLEPLPPQEDDSGPWATSDAAPSLPDEPEDDAVPTRMQAMIGRAMARERASVLDRREFIAYLARVRANGPYAVSCAATGFIYWKLGESAKSIPIADFLPRHEIEERKRFLLGEGVDHGHAELREGSEYAERDLLLCAVP